MNPHPNVFLQIFDEKQDNLKKRLNAYIKEQGSEQIHDIRTSIRRLEAAYFVFPKLCKTKKTDKFLASYKSLFKKNSSIRDYDIIIEKLVKHGISSDSKVILYLIKNKAIQVTRTLKYAKKISKLRKVTLEEVAPAKISTKYGRKVFSLIENLQSFIPVVVSDESKIAELHYMRKIAKKLRYVLEFMPNNSCQRIIDSMKHLQDLLGNIHDCDIAVIFLQRHLKKFPELKFVLIEEQVLRKQTYELLVSGLRDTKV